MRRALLLALWGAVLLQSSLSGRLDLLLRGMFHPLVGLSGVLLLMLATVQLVTGRRQRPGPGQTTPRPWLVSGAVALAVLLMPPSPSFSQLAASRPAQLETEPSLDFLLPPAQRSLTDWVRLLRSQPDPQLYEGDPVRISGFVLETPGEAPQLARLLVRCCLADATPVGLPVRWPSGTRPRPDQWLALQGRMGVERRDEQLRTVVIAEQVRAIPRPRRPLEP
ncbi:MAG: TIGR03943 family putative permease subunit [Cyanobium sp.]